MGERAWIVAAPENEAPYLLEWIAHYSTLGFDGAILFTDTPGDGTDRMAARLQELGHVRHVPLKPRPRRDPMRRGLRALPPILADVGAAWAMPVGIDEFLAIRPEAGDLPALLDAVGPTDAVSVCRKPFGCGGQRGLPEGQLRETHRMAAPEKARDRMIARGIRTLFRPETVESIGPHRPRFRAGPGEVTWLDAGGAVMPESYFKGQWAAWKKFSHRFARLHYYAVPSPETFLIRRGVPQDDEAEKALLAEWQLLDQTGERDIAMKKAVRRSAALLDELRGDETLAALEQAGRAWHLTRAGELAADPRAGRLMAAMAGSDAPAAREKRKKPDQPVRTSPRGGGGTYAPPPVRPVRFDVKTSPDGTSHAVLHAGFHKTATTHLQNLLEENAPWLGRQSVYVVPHQKLRKHVTFPSQLDAYRQLKIKRRTQFTEEELQGFADAFFAEPLALGPRRMILSDENIPGLPAHCVTDGTLYRHRKTFFAAFAKRLPLPVTDVFLAVRSYADFFASAYVEYLRAATLTTKGHMITPEQMRSNVLSMLPTWGAVLTDAAEVFADARIHVWRFEDFAQLRPAILQLFCGDGVDAARLKEEGETRPRPTASARAVEELVLISELEGAAAMAARAREVQERFPQDKDNGRFDPWTPEERAHLGRLYARDWEAIRKDPRFSVLEP